MLKHQLSNKFRHITLCITEVLSILHEDKALVLPHCLCRPPAALPHRQEPGAFPARVTHIHRVWHHPNTFAYFHPCAVPRGNVCDVLLAQHIYIAYRQLLQEADTTFPRALCSSGHSSLLHQLSLCLLSYALGTGRCLKATASCKWNGDPSALCQQSLVLPLLPVSRTGCELCLQDSCISPSSQTPALPLLVCSTSLSVSAPLCWMALGISNTSPFLS